MKIEFMRYYTTCEVGNLSKDKTTFVSLTNPTKIHYESMCTGSPKGAIVISYEKKTNTFQLTRNEITPARTYNPLGYIKDMPKLIPFIDDDTKFNISKLDARPKAIKTRIDFSIDDGKVKIVEVSITDNAIYGIRNIVKADIDGKNIFISTPMNSNLIVKTIEFEYIDNESISNIIIDTALVLEKMKNDMEFVKELI